jgi:hypothetical protein
LPSAFCPYLGLHGQLAALRQNTTFLDRSSIKQFER